MTRLHSLWRGELPLAQAFWNWAVVGGLAVNVTTSVLFVMLILADRPLSALLVGYGLSVPFNAIVLVGVWRSAGRYAGDRRWADLARAVTLVGMILLSVT